MSSTHESKNFFLQGPAGKLEAVLWTPPAAASRTSPRWSVIRIRSLPEPCTTRLFFRRRKRWIRWASRCCDLIFRGAGLSEGIHDEEPQGSLDDVRAAVQYLAAEFPGTSLLVAGFSFGCWVGLRAGCDDARVEKLIGIGAPVNNSDFSYLGKCAKPKLIEQGSNHEHGQVEKVLQMLASLPGENEQVVVHGVDHFFTGKIDELGKAITAWLKPAARNAAKSSAHD